MNKGKLRLLQVYFSRQERRKVEWKSLSTWLGDRCRKAVVRCRFRLAAAVAAAAAAAAAEIT